MNQKILSKNKIIENENLRYCEIYRITNIINNKCYIGQAVSHILNHKKYRPHGMEKRFKVHISEAFSNKENQSYYLNNAIKKYGSSNFLLELIENCEIINANERESYYIDKFNTLYPNGYNLNSGGKQFTHTPESKKRVSNGVIKFYNNQKNKKLIKLTNEIDNLDNIEKYIKPLRRDNNQYGWYLYFGKSKKIDFGGVHITLEESKSQCIDFFNKLKNSINSKAT